MGLIEVHNIVFLSVTGIKIKTAVLRSISGLFFAFHIQLTNSLLFPAYKNCVKAVFGRKVNCFNKSVSEIQTTQLIANMRVLVCGQSVCFQLSCTPRKLFVKRYERISG